MPDKTKKSESDKITVSVGRIKGGSEKITLEDLKELNIKKSDLKRIRKKDKVKGGAKDIKYSLYKSNTYSRIANNFFENITIYLNKKFPQADKHLNSTLRSADIPILTNTYISIILLSSLIAFFGTLFIVFVVSFFISDNIAITIVRSVGFAFLAFIGTFLIIYLYPSFIISGRKLSRINNSLSYA